MSKQPVKPTLSVGNHIYLYQLLSTAIGCGKQTLAPKIEEVLAAERMTAEDLGFSDTRELLEELDDFITLTVFKGGRIYATINAQPAWDEALAAPEKTATQKSGKSWKRKKTDKGLKPVKPRRVKREEPKPQEEPVEEPTQDASETAEEAMETEPQAAAQQEQLAEEPVEQPSEEATSADSDTQEDHDGDADEQLPDDAAEPVDGVNAPEEPEKPEAESPQPAITLTVVYDPENANAGMQTLESTPGISPSEVAIEVQEGAEPEVEQEAARTEAPDMPPAASDKPRAPEPTTETAPQEPADAPTETLEPEPQPATSPEPAPPAAPVIPDDYPRDFTVDVYCPGDLLREISYLLPYGADVMGILNEYYYIAQLRNTIEAARNRATFPFGYARDGERRYATVRIKRSATASGTSWVIDKLEVDEPKGSAE